MLFLKMSHSVCSKVNISVLSVLTVKESQPSCLSLLENCVPDEGKVEWFKYVTAGYLDQHAVLEKGMTVRDVLRTAFDELLRLKNVSTRFICLWLTKELTLML